MATQGKELHIWMNGVRVGYWREGRTAPVFAYFPEWLAHPAKRPVSLSLPFMPNNEPHRGGVVTSYFDNLLPDNINIRRRIGQRYQLNNDEPFTLLSAIGMDCVGAIQLLAPDVVPADVDKIKGVPLDESHIADLLRKASGSYVLGHRDHDEDLRLSIAGAQEKTALLKVNGAWMLPAGSTPTTHILKLPLGLVGNQKADMQSSVENEWLCSKIVAAYGLPVAWCDLARFEDQKVLVVERFDRMFSEDGSWIMRLPQEDMCQATGTRPDLKYQADGGPGIAEIMDLLLGSVEKEADRRRFFAAQIVFWLLFAIDGHAKNFSIRHLAGGQFEATPLYDVLSAFPVTGSGSNHFPRQKAKLAMCIRSRSNHYLITKIQKRHWLAQGKAVGLGEDVVSEMMDYLVSMTDQVIAEVEGLIPAGFPSVVADSIFAGLRQQARLLAAMPAALD